MKVNLSRVIAVTVGIVVIGALGPAAFASPGSGTVSTNLVLADLTHPAHIRSDGVRLQTKKPTDVLVQQFVFSAGGTTGWHHHPGMALIAVQSGAVTFWNSHCKRVTYGPGLPAGSVFIESGNAPGQVTSDAGATTYVTLIAPHAEPPVFRIEDDPPHCA